MLHTPIYSDGREWPTATEELLAVSVQGDHVPVGSLGAGAEAPTSILFLKMTDIYFGFIFS